MLTTLAACLAVTTAWLIIIVPALAPASASRWRQLLRWSRYPQRATRWAKGVDLWGIVVLRPRRGTFRLGRHHLLSVVTEPETSVLVMGPTRSGKTSALIVPNLLHWQGPAVVTSTKEELVELTAGHRQTTGPVYVYDPTGDTRVAQFRVTWSPLEGCHDLDVAWRVASWLCAPLQQGSSRGDSDWAHWAESGKLLAAPLMFAAATTGRSIVDVRTWIHGFDLATPMSLLDDLSHAVDPAMQREALRAITMLLSVDQRPEKERGTVFSTLMRIFSALNERAVEDSALSCQFHPRKLLERNGTLYLCTPRLAPERVASLLVGILMSVVTCAYEIAEQRGAKPLQTPLGLFLDEVANVVPIEDLPAVASQGAGRGVLLMSVIQDLSQLRARYGADKTNSILNNHACKVVLPGVTDPESTEVMSRLAGGTFHTEMQMSRGDDGRVTHSVTRRVEPIVLPDAVRRLREGSALVLNRGTPPLLVSLRPWYRQRRTRQLAQTPYVAAAQQVERLGSG
jgi:type IV secretory pathway TraG/TraD family ATPase VirD4